MNQRRRSRDRKDEKRQQFRATPEQASWACLQKLFDDWHDSWCISLSDEVETGIPTLPSPRLGCQAVTAYWLVGRCETATIAECRSSASGDTQIAETFLGGFSFKATSDIRIDLGIDPSTTPGSYHRSTTITSRWKIEWSFQPNCVLMVECAT